MKRFERLPILQDVVLHTAYQLALASASWLAVADISRELKVAPIVFVDRALERLENGQFVVGHHAIGASSRYQISAKGIEYIQAQLDRPESVVSQFHEKGIDWLNSDDVPAADRYVPLDHNSPEYRDTVTAVEEVISTVKNANDYDDTAEKRQVISALQAARTLLEEAKVRIGAVEALIAPVLKYLLKKFVDTAIGIAAKAALKALAALFGVPL